MPGIARKDQTDSVQTNHGCTPVTRTDRGSSNVFVNNIGAVRVGDTNLTHTFGGKNCSSSHSVPLSSGSPNVFVNNQAVGRLGDAYGSETIISASGNVFAN